MTPEEFNGDWQVATHAIRERDELRTELARERARLSEVRDAARHLANEVAACTGMEEAELRHLLGNTNFNCLVRRMNEVRAILDRKLDAGVSGAGQTEPSLDNPAINRDRSRT
jgi:hypothetical protein